MLFSATTLGAAQAARSITLPAADVEGPGKRAFLEGLRRRNAVLDALFYDVGRISSAEAVSVSPWLATEGAILLVPPSSKGDLVLCGSIEALVPLLNSGEIAALTVAGVGSSALGSAAFARNVADAIDQPVISVVSGYGLADLVTEALGGFFWFGALNGLRHGFESLDTPTFPSESGPLATGGEDGLLARTSRDTATVLALLLDPRLRTRLLIGHSKGNLVISEALYALRDESAERAAAIAGDARIVTVSARIAMPPLFPDVIDVMGSLDWFGSLNSRLSIPADELVPGAWHHTNTELPMHLPVTATLRRVLGMAPRS